MPTHFTLDQLASYLEAEEITFERDDESNAIAFPILCDSGEFDVVFELEPVEGFLGCAIRCPLEFTEEHLPRVYEATARANHLLALGGFQVDSDECELIFVLGVPLEDGDLTPAQLDQVLGSALECADAYEPAFERILGGGDIAAIVAEAEQQPEGE